MSGPGRPSSAIRAKLRGSFDDRIEIIEDIADDEDSTDRLKALKLMAEYGFKEAFDKGLLDELWDATEAAVGDDPALIQRIRKAWSPIIVRKLMANG